jgi:hypothetical protein
MQSSHLLRLPAELRDVIFQYAFDGVIIEFAKHMNHFRVHEGYWARLPFSASQFIATTTACRQIRAETDLLPLRSEFRFPGLNSMAFTLLELTSRHRSQIPVIRLHMSDSRGFQPAPWVPDTIHGLDSLKLITVIVFWKYNVTGIFLRIARNLLYDLVGREIRVEFI